jgi:signal transduction histidine kinase
VVTGFTEFARKVDGNAYDWMLSLHSGAHSRPLASIIIAIDEPALKKIGGMRGLRPAMAEALSILAGQPSVVAADLILSDADPSNDARLEAAFAKTSNLVLASDLTATGWEDPIENFRKHAEAIGHVHAEPDPVSRFIPLEKASKDRRRRWALALEAYRLHVGAREIIESPHEIELGGVRIPTDREYARPLRVRYLTGASAIPRISLLDILQRPELAAATKGKVLFLGVTALSAARDRLMTPNGNMMSGVEIHANVFETLAGRAFLTPASETAAISFSLLLTILAGLIFGFRSGWPAYGLGVLLILSAHAAPHLLFQNGMVFPYLMPAAAAWLAVSGAASYQHFVVRRQLRASETEKTRYQQAIRFVTHEMRTPLTAIQGSSELMGRYNLSEDKRREMVKMIHSESKRLGRMIQTFLDVERLSEGQMQLRREPLDAVEMVESCIGRVSPLAENKRIQIDCEPLPEAMIEGDRELMEYAVYNLLTNAVKYSPPQTSITVSGVREGGSLRISVRDQGIGMDEKELRNIFRKFYRTKKAEASGEPGTGIGLSIVEQILNVHGGSIEVTSSPGHGSCFTMVLPSQAPVRARNR